MKERRKYPRYDVHKDVYVYRAERVGKICNISLGGLMCNCVHHSDCVPVNFDIFCPGNHVCLPDLPYKLVEAKSISSPPHFVRQCHIEFDSLSPEKIFELRAFIEVFALEESPSKLKSYEGRETL